MAERRYNQKELAAILREAGKRQMASSSGGEDTAGYTLEQIQQLASEIGIDPQHVSAVADEAATPTKRILAWGAPPTVVSEKVFRGELSDETWRDMVYELQSELGTTGTLTDSSRDWKGGSDYLYGYLSARPVKGGDTRVRLMLKQAYAMGTFWVFGFAFSFVLSLITGIKMAKHGEAPLWIVAAVLAVIAGVLFLARAGVALYSAKTQSTVDLLTRRIEEIGTRAPIATPEPARVVQTEQLNQTAG